MSAASPDSPADETGPIPAVFLDALVCPFGHQPLEFAGEKLACTHCGTLFRVKDGIPELLREAAILPAGIESVEQLKCWPPDRET